MMLVTLELLPLMLRNVFPAGPTDIGAYQRRSILYDLRVRRLDQTVPLIPHNILQSPPAILRYRPLVRREKYRTENNKT